MSYIIDRRKSVKNKNVVNRKRFLERYNDHIKDAVAEAISKRSISDIDNGEEIHIPNKDLSTPNFKHGKMGKKTIVHPGNKEFLAGDKVARPPKGGGAGGGDASDSGEGEDDFIFQLTREEFLEFLFDDLELPNLTKRQLMDNTELKFKHAGYASEGNPAKMSVIRSLKQSKIRKIATGSKSKKLLATKEAELEYETDELKRKHLLEEIEKLKKKIARIPFLDTTDLRYKLNVKHPTPVSKAVMFCLMDVSGSMTEEIKETAKRFYLLLYLFLSKHYDKTEIVFIRHHTVAKEVNEEDFFYSRETGGTVVSSSLNLMKKIIQDRFPLNEWNIYAAQASDGDNWNDDSPKCEVILAEDILPIVQYFTYVEITKRKNMALWESYEKVGSLFPEVFAQRKIEKNSDIFPVFHDLFQKKGQK